MAGKEGKWVDAIDNGKVQEATIMHGSPFVVTQMLNVIENEFMEGQALPQLDCQAKAKW